jgi:hypothetical protein
MEAEYAEMLGTKTHNHSSHKQQNRKMQREMDKLPHEPPAEREPALRLAKVGEYEAPDIAHDENH